MTALQQRTALLLIDVQRGLFEGKWAVHEALPTVLRLQQVAYKAVAAGVPCFFVQHVESEGEPLAEGSEGWALMPQLTDMPHRAIQKRRPSAFQHTDLHARLQAAGITHLLLGGAQTECCVDTSCRVARELGYEVSLLSDGHSTNDSPVLRASQIIGHHNQILGSMFATALCCEAVTFA